MKLIPGNAASSAAILAAGMAIETLLQFVFVLFISRGLGPEEFGFLGYLMALVVIASMLAHFGVPVVAVREIAQRPDQETTIFAAAFRIRQILGIAFFLLVIAVTLYHPDHLQRTVSIWLVFVYLLVLPFELTPIFDARKLWRWDVPGKLAGRVSSLMLLLILWWIRGEVTLFDAALCTAVVNAVNVIVGWRIARAQGIRVRLFERTNEVKSLFAKSAPVAWSNLMAVLYSQTQIVFVQWMSTAVQTGCYALTMRLLMPILLFKGILYRILLPLVSGVARNATELGARLEYVFPILALLFIPLTALAILLANTVLVPLFGVEYIESVLPFQIAASQFVFTGFASLFGSALLAAGNTKPLSIGLTIGSIVGLLTGYLLVPKYGAIGAAWSFWISELVSSLYPIPAFFRYCRPRIANRIIRITVPCVLAVAINFFVIIIWNVPATAAALLAFVLMILGLMLTGEISRKRLKNLSELIRGLKSESQS